jgi:rod shape-determining protein MreD
VREALARLAGALAFVVLQTSGGGVHSVGGVHPDVLLLLVLYAGMRGGEGAGSLWGVLLGFFEDTFSAGFPGLNLLTKGLLGFAAGTLRSQLDCGNPNTQAIVAVAATLAEGGAHLVLLHVFSAGREVIAPFLGTVLPAALAHGVLLPVGVAMFRAGGRQVRFLRRRLAPPA